MACNSACALCDNGSENILCMILPIPILQQFFFFLEDPAAFCIAMDELVSQLSFCVKLSCEKELYGKLFYDLLYFSLCSGKHPRQLFPNQFFDVVSRILLKPLEA